MAQKEGASQHSWLTVNNWAGPSLSAALDLTHLNLPEEVSTKEAARILDCSKNTVLEFLRAGALEWRNAASPTSSRPVYRFTLRSVVALRTRYQQEAAGQPRTVPRARRTRQRTGAPYKVKHIHRKDPG